MASGGAMVLRCEPLPLHGASYHSPAATQQHPPGERSVQLIANETALQQKAASSAEEVWVSCSFLINLPSTRLTPHHCPRSKVVIEGVSNAIAAMQIVLSSTPGLLLR
eukprot:4068554-Amphidinium_carterae.2